MDAKRPFSHPPTPAQLVEGIRRGERTLLARALTLIESNAPQHIEQAQDVLQPLMPLTGNSIRVGITGVPGAGKSTLIEALGLLLLAQGHRVAVLAVDPSSTLTGGSILGDKTRMARLANEPNAFIRPSPTSGVLGGVARKTRESILLCEAFGFDVILVETVGTGQSEVTVRSMVDFFMLLLIAGGGDELQGIKKGVMELADAVVINKADGDNKRRAQTTRSEINRALHFLTAATDGWTPRAHTASALTGDGIAELWQLVLTFAQQMQASGVWQTRRQAQSREWLYGLLNDRLLAHFLRQPQVKVHLPTLEQQVMSGAVPVGTAVKQLLALLIND